MGGFNGLIVIVLKVGGFRVGKFFVKKVAFVK